MMHPKNKTLASWLAFLGGAFGLHRFYLYGLDDTIAWLHPIPTALGLYGIDRILSNGVDDQMSWMLVPLLGFTIAACALTAIIYGLMASEKWNARFNPQLAQDAPSGATNWFTICGVAASLLIGTAILMASLAYSFEHYFQYQIEQARKISQ